MRGWVFHFRVEERFAGVKGSTIDVVDVPPIEGSTGYAESVKRYLVFARNGSDESVTRITLTFAADGCQSK